MNSSGFSPKSLGTWFCLSSESFSAFKEKLSFFEENWLSRLFLIEQSLLWNLILHPFSTSSCAQVERLNNFCPLPSRRGVDPPPREGPLSLSRSIWEIPPSYILGYLKRRVSPLGNFVRFCMCVYVCLSVCLPTMASKICVPTKLVPVFWKTLFIKNSLFEEDPVGPSSWRGLTSRQLQIQHL